VSLTKDNLLLDVLPIGLCWTTKGDANGSCYLVKVKKGAPLTRLGLSCVTCYL